MAQIENPTQIIVVSEKGDLFDDSWFKPPKNLYDKADYNQPVLALSRHERSALPGRRFDASLPTPSPGQ